MYLNEKVIGDNEHIISNLDKTNCANCEISKMKEDSDNKYLVNSI
jgi:hypothetical protein